MNYDVIIKNGLYFDGSNQPGQVRHVGIKDGRIDVLSLSPLDESGCPEVLDASDKWVTPGFLEIHSHYDAEVIAAPRLERIRAPRCDQRDHRFLLDQHGAGRCRGLLGPVHPCRSRTA